MKILFLAIGNKYVASSRIRVYQYIPYLRKEGIKCSVISYIPAGQFNKTVRMERQSFFAKIIYKVFSMLKLIKFILLSPKYNILFIQKVLLPVKIQNLINSINKNIVFDFDDAIFLSDQIESKDSHYKDKFTPRLEHILRISKCVIVGNSYLKKYVVF